MQRDIGSRAWNDRLIAKRAFVHGLVIVCESGDDVPGSPFWFGFDQAHAGFQTLLGEVRADWLLKAGLWSICDVSTGDNNRGDGNAVRLLKRVVCPNCWSEAPPHSMLWVSQHESLLGDPRLGDQEYQRFLPSRFTIRGNALDARETECHELACPHCHLKLPRDLLELPPCFVSVFGTRGSGKSFFLSSMTHSLRQSFPLDFAISFRDTDPESNLRLRRMEDLLFANSAPEQRVILSDLILKTQEAGAEAGINLVHRVNFGGNDYRDFPQPFMFTLQLTGQHRSAERRGDFGRVLCLYDNAGESFRPGSDSEPLTRHLGKSELLLFTYDPMQDPGLQKLIQSVDPGRMPANVYREPQEPVLQEAAKRVKQFAGLSLRAKHRVPLIVIVTKFDCWAELLSPIDHTANPWRQVRIKSGNDESSNDIVMAVDGARIREISEQVRRLLMKTSPEIVAAAEGFSDDVSYVPVSAIGWESTVVDVEGQEGQFQIRPVDTRPFWAAVPLLYGLSKILPGLIPVLKP